jgi:outer membrane lipoprotein-sorting protein
VTRGHAADRARTDGNARETAAATLLAAFLVAFVAGIASADGDGSSTVGAPADLEALMAGMAGTSGVVAGFREVKRLALLTEPLESHGTLYFVPPGRLARVTRTPSATRLVIDGDRFSFDDGTSDRAMDLSSNPVAREVVANFIVLFNGDLDALQRRYEPRFETGADGWSLSLTPRRAPLRDIIERVTLEGRGHALTRMELLETGGDSTSTFFEDVHSDHAFDDAELARIFGENHAASDAR